MTGSDNVVESTIVGIDVGGTFTDLACADPTGRVTRVLKVPSTPDDPALGVVDALERSQVALESLSGLLHGTTIATNATIQRTGARCALISTKGFRDILELGRRDRRELYGLTGLQDPLIDRANRWEVDERIDFQGNVLVPVDSNAVAELARGIAETDINVIVIALLHSYANPQHEEQVAKIFRSVKPEWHVVTSHSVVSEYYEFERTSTAVVQGYLEPLVSNYATSLAERLSQKGFRHEPLVMQSNGGVVPLRRLASKAACIIRSGPAAGVTAAAQIAAAAGFRHVITGDMGGTSFDVAVVTDGEPHISETTLLDFRVPLRIPMIDVHTIGAGGGSIASLDRGGTLQVGPRSAGAIPGPICFRRGGTEPTVTDANVVLGRINADKPIGEDSTLSLDLDAARDGLARLGEALGMGVEDTAEAILAVVNIRMAGRMRLISVEKGLDPRDFALVAFGGAGPVHAAALMRDVGVKTLLVPPNPGVLCAQGCITADVRYDYSNTVERRVDALQDGELATIFEEQRQRGLAEIESDDVFTSRIDYHHQADMAYVGQVHRILVDVQPDWSVGELKDAFVEAYSRELGSPLGDMPVLLVNVRTSVRGRRNVEIEPASSPPDRGCTSPRSSRKVYFAGQWHDTPIYDREDLQPGMRFEGPAIVEQSDTTTVIEPEMTVWIDGHSNLQIERKAA